MGQEGAAVLGERGAGRRPLKSAVPSSASRAAIRFEIACWLTSSRSAARWNWPSCATDTNALTASMFMLFFLQPFVVRDLLLVV